MRLLILLLCFSLFPLQGEQIILGYPRSGNTWTIAVFQILTKRPVFWLDLPRVPAHAQVLRPLKFPIDGSKPPLFFSHDPYHALKKVDQSNTKLLFLLRNYKECIVRECHYSPEELRDCVLLHKEHFKLYMDNLIFFDQWCNENTKHMIYYEELISSPRPVIENMLAFLEEYPDNLEDFFANFDYWKELVITKYAQVWNTMPSSHGDKKVFHSKDFPPEIINEIDTFVQQRYPLLWEKYLSIYQEPFPL